MDDQHNERDQELDRLLAPLRKIQATPAQAAAWNNAMKSAHVPKRSRGYPLRLIALPQLVAALVLGFIMGALTIRFTGKTGTQVTENSEASATIEHIYAKAD